MSGLQTLWLYLPDDFSFQQHFLERVSCYNKRNAYINVNVSNFRSEIYGFLPDKLSTYLLKSLSRSGRVDKMMRADCITSIRSSNSCIASWRSIITVLRQDGLQTHSRSNLKIYILGLEYMKKLAHKIKNVPFAECSATMVQYINE